MPRTLGLLIAVLIIALLGALAITLNGNTGLLFLKDDIQIGKAESLDIHGGNGIDVSAGATGNEEVQYVISAHLEATIGGGTPVPHTSGTGTAVADTIDVESPDGSLKVTATHNTSAGHNVIEFDLTEAGIDFYLNDTKQTTNYDTTATPPGGPRPALSLASSDSSITIGASDNEADNRFDYDLTDPSDGIEFYLNGTQVGTTVFDEVDIKGTSSGNVTVTATESGGRVTYELTSTPDDTIAFSNEGSNTPATSHQRAGLDLIEGDGIDIALTEGTAATDSASYEIEAEGLRFWLDGSDEGDNLYAIDLNSGAGIHVGYDDVAGKGTYTIATTGATVDFTVVLTTWTITRRSILSAAAMSPSHLPRPIAVQPTR